MAQTLQDLVPEVANRLNDPGMVFYAQSEIEQAIAEGAHELALISGEPEVQTGVLTVPANTRLVNMPSGLLVPVRLAGAESLSVEKCSLWDLDRQLPEWEADTGDAVQYWFPYGLGVFGVYPLLNGDAQITMSALAIPLDDGPNFTGSEPIPFQNEYQDALVSYASHIVRLKEGGVEFQASIQEYERFLKIATSLSRFAIRTGSLRFSRTGGMPAAQSPVEVR